MCSICSMVRTDSVKNINILYCYDMLSNLDLSWCERVNQDHGQDNFSHGWIDGCADKTGKHEIIKSSDVAKGIYGVRRGKHLRPFSLVQSQGSMPESRRYLSVQNDYAAAIREFLEMTWEKCIHCSRAP